MIKIYGNIPNYADGTSWYRGAGPMLALQKMFRDKVQVQLMTADDDIDWYRIADGDLCFLQRPFNMGCVGVMNLSKMFGMKVIADWDDEMSKVHISNPVAPLYDDPQIQENFKLVAQQADAVWTTTEYLRGRLDTKAGSEKTEVIPNAWPDLWYKFSEPGDQNLIYWRGGSSHQGDIFEFLGDIATVASRTPLWKWALIGDPPWFMRDVLRGKATKIDWKPNPLFLREMLQLRPKVVVVPLQDTAFNRSKSSIAWMEAVAAGSVAVTRDWEEWQVPGAIHYGKDKSFADAVMEAVSLKPEKRKEMVKEGQQYILDNLLLSAMTEKRMEAIERLLK